MDQIHVTPQLVQEACLAITDSYTGLGLGLPSILREVVIEDKLINLKFSLGYPFNEATRQTIIQSVQSHLTTVFPTYSFSIILNWKIQAHHPKKAIKALPNIKNIIAIASGKGGVGKSTIALNISLALLQQGARVGLLDADIYGPSLPLLLGLPHLQPNPTKTLQPLLRYGLQTMSLGYLINSEAPAMWRGPMASTAVKQLLTETAWDNLDYLIIDLPPGTGDIQLTLAQQLPLNGVVMATTAAPLSQIDVIKAIQMFQKLEINILGIVENLSSYTCNHCGHHDMLFPGDAGNQISKQFSIPLLANIPFNKISYPKEEGMMLATDFPLQAVYGDLARKVAALISLQSINYSVGLPPIKLEVP